MTDEKLDWLDEVHTSVRLMEDTASDLLILARKLAFFMPQSPALDEMKAWAIDLTVQAKRLDQASSDKLHADFRQAQHHSTNLFRATLAGMINSGKCSQDEDKALRGLMGAVENDKAEGEYISEPGTEAPYRPALAAVRPAND